MKHVVIYVPGLGDTNNVIGRRLLTGGWRLYGVQPVVHQMNWADKQPFEPKLAGLLQHIDNLAAAGKRVSLVGESAGASAAINAYAVRTGKIHRVACICGKLRSAHIIHPATYGQNPAFGESLALLPASLASLSSEQLARVRSVHPLEDPVVPVADTIIPGAEAVSIPTTGHVRSIVLGTTVFSYQLIGFIKRR